MRKGHVLVDTLGLFSSMGTMICCALPALFVVLGMGATFAGIISEVPQLVWLSEYKIYLFSFAGVMLTLSGILRYRGRFAPCPTDPLQANACAKLRRISGVIFYSSLALYITGFFFAFIAPRLL